DGASAFTRSGITRDRSNTDQGSDLLAVKGAQFGQLCHQGARANGSDPGERAQQILLSTPYGRGLNQPLQLPIAPINALLEDLDQALDITTHPSVAGLTQAVLLHDEHLHQLATPAHKLIEHL